MTDRQPPVDPAATGGELASEPPPQFDAEELEWALREVGPPRPVDEDAPEHGGQPTENDPGASHAERNIAGLGEPSGDQSRSSDREPRG